MVKAITGKTKESFLFITGELQHPEIGQDKIRKILDLQSLKLSEGVYDPAVGHGRNIAADTDQAIIIG